MPRCFDQVDMYPDLAFFCSLDSGHLGDHEDDLREVRRGLRVTWLRAEATSPPVGGVPALVPRA